MADNKIKVSEVSDVLRAQLEGIDSSIQLDEVGTVLQISDGVARIYGLRNAESNELLEFENGMQAIVMNLEEDNVGAVLLGPTSEIKENDSVKRTGRVASIFVSEDMLSRVINPLGEPLDGRGKIGGEMFEMPLERKAPGVIYRQPVNQPLQTGLKSIDSMIPIGRGQRELIIGDRQTGKTTIAVDTILNQKENYDAGDPVYCIYVAIGQKGSTVATIVEHCANMEQWTTQWCCSQCFRPCRTSILRSICRSSNWRILQRHWAQCVGYFDDLSKQAVAIAKYHLFFAALQVVKPIQEMFSIYTHACWSVLHVSSLSKK